MDPFPRELLHEIVKFSSQADLAAWRSVDRDLRDFVTPIFGKTFFERRYHVMSLYGLQMLVRISNHGTWGPFVRTIGLGAYRFTEEGVHVYKRTLEGLAEKKRLDAAAGSGEEGWSLSTSMTTTEDWSDDYKIQVYRRNMYEQRELLNAPELLELVFKNLKRLGHTIEVTAYQDFEDDWPIFGAALFYDGIRDLLHSDWPGEANESYIDDMDYQSTLVLLLEAAYKAECKVDVRFRFTDRDTSRFIEEICDRARLAEYVSNVHSLYAEPQLGLPDLDNRDHIWYKFLLGHTSHLERLELDLDLGNNHDWNDHYWLSGADEDDAIVTSGWISQPLSTTCLQHVSLKGLHGTNPTAIIEFLGKHKSTLRTLTLANSRLGNDDEDDESTSLPPSFGPRRWDNTAAWNDLCIWINQNLKLDSIRLDNTRPMHNSFCSCPMDKMCQVVPVVQLSMPVDASALCSHALNAEIAEAIRKNHEIRARVLWKTRKCPFSCCRPGPVAAREHLPIRDARLDRHLNDPSPVPEGEVDII